MTLNTHTLTHKQLAEDICFLAEHARCPQRQRRLLLEWSQLVQCRAESAFREDTLFDIINALVTLSHANAAFSRAAAPPFCRVEPALIVEDQGGYFAGRMAITALIRAAPIQDELRISLANYVLTRIDQDLRHLQILVPFY